MVSAIIVAAGKGVRMDAATRKQYLDIRGTPIVIRTLMIFSESPLVDTICLVVPPADEDYCRDLVLAYPEIHDKCRIIQGGATRQGSVYNGLVALEKDVSESCPVLIHDGVRPLVTLGQIEACVSSVEKHGSGVLAVPAQDTLKQSAEDSNVIEKTLARHNVWLAQTPQAFTYSLIRGAHERAMAEGVSGTDDAMLVERLPHPVHMVPGSKTNMKITTPEDLALAEALLSIPT